MKIVTMKHDTDCEVAMLATALQVDYETACKAINWKKLPYGLENPVYGNPYNVYLALLKLGYWKQNLNWKEFLKYNGICCVLIHDNKHPYIKQHWIVRESYQNGYHKCYFGYTDIPVYLDNNKIKRYIFDGYPNCIFKPYKCDIFTRIFKYIKLKLKGIIKWL